MSVECYRGVLSWGFNRIMYSFRPTDTFTVDRAFQRELGLKVTTRRAAIMTGSPVRGLRPRRAPLLRTLKLPRVG